MLIIKGANEIATCKPRSAGAKTGADFSHCGIITDGSVVIEGAHIVAVGETKEILRAFRPKRNEVIDASGKTVIPGFVDCHTHAVFAGSRAEEYQLKMLGADYQDLHRQKGGIHLTVEATRNATEDALFVEAQRRLGRMLQSGTTTLEIKSGYGLTTKDELKILRVVKRLSDTQPQGIISTFLGAHTIPLEYAGNRKEYMREILETMLPTVSSEHLAEYCDVFCDPLGFTPEETRRILSRAREYGMSVRLHAEQTARSGGAQIAGEFRAASADHCDFANADDLHALAKSGTVAVVLPGVFFHLMEWGKQAQIRNFVREAREAGVPLAIATDYNPGSSPVLSMKLIMDFALRFFGLSYEECLNAATINAAYALGRGSATGSIEEGKQADILIVGAPTVHDFLHEVGDQRIETIIKNGLIVSKGV